MEQKNNTLLEMGVYDDGPYEVGDEHQLNPELVPLPANSYLGECPLTVSLCSALPHVPKALLSILFCVLLFGYIVLSCVEISDHHCVKVFFSPELYRLLLFNW